MNCRSQCLTLATGGKHEDIRVFLTHPVNHVYLLQRLSDSIFVLSVTGDVCCPELRTRAKIILCIIIFQS